MWGLGNSIYITTCINVHIEHVGERVKLSHFTHVIGLTAFRVEEEDREDQLIIFHIDRCVETLGVLVQRRSQLSINR